MASDENQLELLEQRITDYQKQIQIKRENLKNEFEKENEDMVKLLQTEITELRDKILFSQGELRKKYLIMGNRKIEKEDQKQKVKTEIFKQG
jgi:hypothetical protein